MTGRRILADVNALAIQLVDDHPGHPYVADELVPALAGEDTLVVFGYLPLRVQWILEDLGFDTVDARNAVSSLLGRPMAFVDADDDTLLDAYELSAAKNHDVYDCFYLSLARQSEADVLLTTDSDLEGLCADESVDYLNPVPEDVIAEFHAAGE